MTATAISNRRSLSGAVALAVLVALSGTAAAQQRITTNFKDADLGQVAEAVAAVTGKNFVVDPRVRAQVNLISSTPMSANEFYQAFLSILQVNGFVAIPTGSVIKIVPDANVRTMAMNDLPDRISNTSDEMVTQVVTIRNTSAAQLTQVLRPLVAQYGHLVSVPGSNSLIISDRANNVARILKIIERVDRAGDAAIDVIPLQNSTASDVVRTLTALTAGQAAAEGAALAPKVVADDRSNSVLVSGESAQRLRIGTLVAHLDTPIDNGGDTQVRYLRYADAEKIAPKLKEMATGVVAQTGGAAAGGAAAGGADRNLNIWAEPQTNALVITAPPKAMRSLMTIVDKLDIRRAQVLVEAIIVDVRLDKAADLGVNWAVWSSDGSNVPAGGFVSPVGSANNNPVSIVDLARAAANPAAATSVPLGTTFGIGRLSAGGVNFAAMLRAMRSDSNTNVIATPSATTMDNEETELKVAQEVPFITGQYTNSTSTNTGGGIVNPFTTVQRQEVGTILKITPQINEGDAVQLKIELESSELSGSAGDANSLITNKRVINTTVLIEDQGVVVLGGLIRDSVIDGETRVPFLGRIPLLGEAFKSRNAKREKSNLMVFIRPKILRDGVQTSFETNAKYNTIRDAQQQALPSRQLVPLLPFETRPQLPPLPVPQAAPVPAPPAVATPAE